VQRLAEEKDKKKRMRGAHNIPALTRQVSMHETEIVVTKPERGLGPCAPRLHTCLRGLSARKRTRPHVLSPSGHGMHSSHSNYIPECLHNPRWGFHWPEMVLRAGSQLPTLRQTACAPPPLEGNPRKACWRCAKVCCVSESQCKAQRQGTARANVLPGKSLTARRLRASLHLVFECLQAMCCPKPCD
jgi:hypothetical protein